MAKKRITLSYAGWAQKPLEWDALLRIFDTIFGVEARSLPSYPDVIGGVSAYWQDVSGIEHEAAAIDELGAAYRQSEAGYIMFDSPLGLRHGPRVTFECWPSRAEAKIGVNADERLRADNCIAAVKREFPFATKYVFVSYDTREIKLASYVKKILEARLAPGISVFVAKGDISPGAHPYQVLFEEQLLRSEALVALCSHKSKRSPWLWWESATVWAQGGLVVPLYIGLSPNEFGGPISQVCQGREYFDVAEITSALSAVANRVCPEQPFLELSEHEINELEQLKKLST